MQWRRGLSGIGAVLCANARGTTPRTQKRIDRCEVADAVLNRPLLLVKRHLLDPSTGILLSN